ncbi:MAG TPA: PhoU domain-containing protein [Microlunatus sp.]
MNQGAARLEFGGDLVALRADLVAMTVATADAIRLATSVLLHSRDGDGGEEADEIGRLRERVESLRDSVEQRTHQLLARQQPVAGDLRLLVAALRITAHTARMARLAGHIGQIAARRRPVPVVPQPVVGVVAAMGELAYRIADGAALTLAAGDAQDAARLEIDDDSMDELLRRLFSVLLDHWPHGVESAVDLALVGRYYERFADHAVDIAASVVFIVSSRRESEDLM